MASSHALREVDDRQNDEDEDENSADAVTHDDLLQTKTRRVERAGSSGRRIDRSHSGSGANMMQAARLPIGRTVQTWPMSDVRFHSTPVGQYLSMTFTIENRITRRNDR